MKASASASPKNSLSNCADCTASGKDVALPRGRSALIFMSLTGWLVLHVIGAAASGPDRLAGYRGRGMLGQPLIAAITARAGDPTEEARADPARPGSTVEQLTTDWKKTALLAVAATALVIVLLVVGRFLFRLVLFVLCLAGGVGASIFLSPRLEPLVGDWFPPVNGTAIRADILAGIVAFLIGYAGTCIVIAILLKPLKLGRKKE